MIRINLLAGERRAAKTSGRSLPMVQKMTVAGTVILLLTALVIGWRFWALRQQDAQLTADTQAARREETRLAEVLRQVSDFEAQRAQLQQRVALIDELRKGQTAPVHMIDQISRSIPEMMWLTNLQQEGYEITIEGRSTTLAALSDFVANLEATHYFKRPVEIVESAVMRAQNNGPELIEFTIKGTFQMSGLPAPPPAKGRGRGGKVG